MLSLQKSSATFWAAIHQQGRDGVFWNMIDSQRGPHPRAWPIIDNDIDSQ
jgi:hypothetical protein